MNYESWKNKQRDEILEKRNTISQLRRIEQKYGLDMTQAIEVIWAAEEEKSDALDHAFCVHHQRASRKETPDALNVLHDVWKDIINTPRNLQSDVFVFIYAGESWVFESEHTASISLHLSKAVKLHGTVFYLNPKHGVFRTILGQLR